MIYDILKELNINYEEVEHEAVYSVEEAKKIENMIDGIGTKTLFLKVKKKYYLVIMEENKHADIKGLSDILNTSRLSFASPERLKEVLNLEVGSVTPFGIINDIDNKVMLLIDKDLEDNKLLFHPNTNTKTISIDYRNLIKFIEYENHVYIIY